MYWGSDPGWVLIRISSTEREQFIELCEQLDTSAAREIRQFIRGFIKNLKKKINARKAKVAKHEAKIKSLKKKLKKAA